MPQTDPYRMLSDLRNLIALLDRRITQAQETGPQGPGGFDPHPWHHK
jgi:hypothetical protein